MLFFIAHFINFYGSQPTAAILFVALKSSTGLQRQDSQNTPFLLYL